MFTRDDVSAALRSGAPATDAKVMDSRRVGTLSGAMVALTTCLAGAMRISALKMQKQLMVVTASEASARGTRRGSARPDECSSFRHRVIR